MTTPTTTARPQHHSHNALSQQSHMTENMETLPRRYAGRVYYDDTTGEKDIITHPRGATVRRGSGGKEGGGGGELQWLVKRG